MVFLVSILDLVLTGWSYSSLFLLTAVGLFDRLNVEVFIR
jgi:hypothetical protein